MKNIVVILSIIYSFFVSSQSTNIIKNYTWEEAQKVSKDSVFSITFSGKKLAEVPIELFQYTHLKRLDLGKNKLVNLPDEFVKLSELEYLNLEKNRFVFFPNELCQLYNLTELILNRNDIISLPDCIERLDSLIYLDIWATPIAQFPEAFKKMQALKKIDARGISHGRKFQERNKESLPQVTILFDTPCNCLD